jgi:LacI family transcriptional regulator
LPEHLEGEYWTAVEIGIHEAIATYSISITSVKINYYDPYDYHHSSTPAKPSWPCSRTE